MKAKENRQLGEAAAKGFQDGIRSLYAKKCQSSTGGIKLKNSEGGSNPLSLVRNNEQSEKEREKWL